VEADPQACREAERWLDHAAMADASEWEPPVERGYFDALVFADVLEHFRDPRAVLERYLPWLKPAGAIVFSIPNVRFWGVVKHLVEGHWTYQDEGILDRGHLRFFTWKEIERLLSSCGLEVEAVHRNLDPRCPEPAPGTTMDLDLGRITVRDVSPEEVREFFVFQYLVRAVRSESCLSAEAERLERDGRHAEAFELYAGLAGRGGSETRWVLKLGEICRTESEKKRFFGLLEERLSLQPANIDLLLASARLFTQENRYEDARARLERAVLFAPEHAEARHRLRELPAA
jgi:SAM-dependent methyltransferase